MDRIVISESPVYWLDNAPDLSILGGKVRMGADCYFHAAGRDFVELEERVRAAHLVHARALPPGVHEAGNAIHGPHLAAHGAFLHVAGRDPARVLRGIYVIGIAQRTVHVKA